MSSIGQRERLTQDRVVGILSSQLNYEYAGDWKDRGNSNVEEELLRQNLLARGYSEDLVRRAIQQFVTAASLPAGGSLYDANRRVYGLLRYGVKVKRSVSENFETVWLIDWKDPEANHFVVAEEVSIKGKNTKRPDVVLYVNGIALGVIELKRSKVSVGDGIRQHLGNQKADFVRPFFTTVQLLFAGNDVEGLRYGVIETPEKYWLEWTEPSEVEKPLDRGLLQMANKQRFLELIHDYIVFDSGVKKTARHNQYFGVKAAQERIARREGGIIWHTQGSGKSLTMVWLAKWIRENQREARVLVITDRTELDEQIEKVFAGVDETIDRSTSGSGMIGMLNRNQPWLMCSLVHKFRGDDEKDQGDTEDFVRQLKKPMLDGFSPKGNLFVFVDEAHRTQSGKLHSAMKELLPNAMFIGFTGTPLLKKDKASSIEAFGSYIHTYKFDEAVKDKVVLDLRYEARDIEQKLMSPERVDEWFKIHTKGMTDLSKHRLKQRWATIKAVESAEPRARQIAADILMDMARMPRLMDGRGNAMLVCSSVYQACKFYEIFSRSELAGKIAIITSYEPNASQISKEDSGAGKNEEIVKYETYRRMLADYFQTNADDAAKRIEEFEKSVKETFIKHPGQMRLLIVVDKLLTGFDAPSATYLYIDKNMQDHGLFQAICRVNRLDGDDKEYGYIVDYRDLFKSLETAVSDYTSEAFGDYDQDDIDGLLKDRIEQERQDLDDALEKVRALCEPVAPPKGTLQYQHYFCAIESGNAEQLKANEPKRVDLYKGVASLVRAYANLANRMSEAGYSETDAEFIKRQVKHFVDVRDEVKLGAGENMDLKQFEAGMRSLLDTYIQADASRNLATFDQGLVQLIVEHGVGALEKLPENIRKTPEAAAETIVNNVRKTIVDEQAMNPKYYESMSTLLDALIEQRREAVIDYEEYLLKLVEFTQRLAKGESDRKFPDWAKTPARRALIDFAWPQGIEVDVERVYSTIQRNKEHGWSGDKTKQKSLMRTLALNFPGLLDKTQMESLLDQLKKHDEFR
ncbi:HsdR family type I site-specific deoxyribonuclease [Corynebacterium glutamicum]|uniref:type I restriction endonuclease subunit R n=1 Tax=Corynebacterium TaxID=1716 RepID=UPI00019623F8|nr:MULTISPECIES: HsdR family type I site-specific deoxyribonuclease [Corynebacterium]ANR62370.1 DNA restriction-modification system, restriction enzyme [[Brevibacterium] flavum ZL-1]ANR65376.1 DNA restriction-modification system, restriction enzyme [Corynebacterium glutamicum ZL-6]ANU33513.1 restriction endonuclease subunit R [Corynebacterium glutamicum]APT07260.1 restriction endonuclease subunit R [Corynebacterium glutamicum]PST75731.1 DNA restriction-modification system, restriction enzyme [